MRRVWTIFLFLLFLGAGGASVFSEDVKHPKAVVPEQAFDFKSVDEGSVIEHAFVIRNEGEAPLNVLDVRTG